MPRKQTKKRRPTAESELRIIGGSLRGRKLLYNGDPATRPMKDRTREAVFNLVGPSIKGMHAVDLFAGTGAIGLEAISRGAASATLIERNFVAAGVIEQNVKALQLSDIVSVAASDTFYWINQQCDLPSDTPWAVFCSPPYAMYVEQEQPLLELLTNLMENAPTASAFVVESDNQFDHQSLPNPDAWDVRTYSPAVVGLYRKEE